MMYFLVGRIFFFRFLPVTLTLLSLILFVVSTPEPGLTADIPLEQLRNEMSEKFGHALPVQWGEDVRGVKHRQPGGEMVVALTMDACGSAKGMGYDSELLAFLERENIPATLFINARWIGPNRAVFDQLAANPLFEIANHGFYHKPASVNGKQIYGIKGTKNVAELVDEIELNARKIEELTGRRPRFYRSGTAYYDELAVQVSEALGHKVAGFSVLGDAGATLPREKVKQALLTATPGAIIIVHMNHPESGTGKGVLDAIPELLKRGYRFVRLSDMNL